jgi:hypothetical protein
MIYCSQDLDSDNSLASDRSCLRYELSSLVKDTSSPNVQLLHRKEKAEETEGWVTRYV